MRISAALTAAAALSLAACGDDEDSTALVISAASSLETAFTSYADKAGIDAKQSFAGSDELAAQIRQGVAPDVYAAANTRLPDELYGEDLVSEPVVFAANTVVIGVPADSDIQGLEDLEQPGTTIAIGDGEVPVGQYTRDVLDRLPTAQRDAILGNVRSEEPEVSGIIGKLTQGAVDAGFVYMTDVTAVGDALRAVKLPPDLESDVAYGAAVVAGAENPEGAQNFIVGLLDGDGAEALREAGFLPPP
jgi:molybdate transport system substrate-binding protein